MKLHIEFRQSPSSGGDDCAARFLHVKNVIIDVGTVLGVSVFLEFTGSRESNVTYNYEDTWYLVS